MSSDIEKKKNKKNGSSKARWIFRVCILAFGLSVFFSLISGFLLNRFSIYISLIILFTIITIGIIFDIIGIAVTSANEAPFHAMAADKVPGGREAVKLVRNAEIVSSFCNDIVGDICGILSGAAGAAIIVKTIAFVGNEKEMLLNILLTGIISTLTIVGKAFGKGIAINHSKTVVYSVALLLYKIKKRLNVDVLKGNNGNKMRNRRGK